MFTPEQLDWLHFKEAIALAGNLTKHNSSYLEVMFAELTSPLGLSAYDFARLNKKQMNQVIRLLDRAAQRSSVIIVLNEKPRIYKFVRYVTSAEWVLLEKIQELETLRQFKEAFTPQANHEYDEVIVNEFDRVAKGEVSPVESMNNSFIPSVDTLFKVMRELRYFNERHSNSKLTKFIRANWADNPEKVIKLLLDETFSSNNWSSEDN